MFKTSEILTIVLILSILLFLYLFYKDNIIKNKYIKKITNFFDEKINMRSPKTFDKIKESSDNYFESIKESSDNLFATEYEVSEGADEAISDALKNLN